MMLRALICGVILTIPACAPVEHAQSLSQPIGKVQTVPVGGEIASISKQKNLPNAFGAADVFGRKVDTGLVKIVYQGQAKDGGPVLRQIDIDVHSTASTMSRTPAFYTASSNAMAHGYGNRGHATITGSSQSSAFAMAPVAETNTVLPPNVTQFTVPKGKTLTLATGQTVEFIDVQPHQISYRIIAAR